MTYFTSQTNKANGDINQPARCSGQCRKTGLSSAAAGGWVQRLRGKLLRAMSHVCCLSAGTARAQRGFIPQSLLGYYLLCPAAPGCGSRALLRSQGMDPALGSHMAGKLPPAGSARAGASLPAPPGSPWHPEPKHGRANRVPFPGTLHHYKQAAVSSQDGGDGGAGSSPTSIATLLPRAEILVPAAGCSADHRSAPNPLSSVVAVVPRQAESRRALPAGLGLCNYLLRGQGNPH